MIILKQNRNDSILSMLLHYGAAAKIGLLVKMLTVINMHLANIIMKELQVNPPY